MINPAVNSRWSTVKNGSVYNITIDGMWATGIGDRFRVISYDLKYDHIDALQNLGAEKLIKLINDKILNPL